MNSSSGQLAVFLGQSHALAVVSGAGVSTASGIPDYRDKSGDWKHAAPIQYQDFVKNDVARQRYWARSYVGWQRFSRARPNAAHYALAEMEAAGKVDTVVTQNVDRLHSAAGSRRVIDLHGDLGRVRCLDCQGIHTRIEFQQALEKANPNWHAEVFRYKPDGDAELADDGHHAFAVPGCMTCGGIVKPDVVMFGENVPRKRVLDAMAVIDRADALLVVGSSLMLFSGFRFAREAAAQDKPIAIVTDGRTRADDLATLKIEADCGPLLSAAVGLLAH
ncbi:MAG: NAD-dependent protein deacetylase [Woeseiaceae bacterium]|nr:NAD-dependent protein deacetylase [Woeseiaceae bacterium]